MKKLIFMAMILISFISCSTSVDTGKAPAEEKVIMQTRSVVASDQGSNTAEAGQTALTEDQVSVRG